MEISFLSFFSNLISNHSLLITTILISIVMFINGCSDVPNAIATCISTRSLRPNIGIVLALISNTLGLILMTYLSSNVAKSVYNLVNFGGNPSISLVTLCCALVGISIWCFIAWKFGIPSSQSHALIAGISGAAIALMGNLSAINFNEWKKVLYGLIFVNLLAFILGYLITKIIEAICKEMDRRKTNKFFKFSQVIGALTTCFMNGAQDGQKFMSFMLLGLVLSNGMIPGSTNFSIPIWLMIYTSIIISLGTLIGGMRIIKIMGTKVTKVESYQGTSADIASSICLFGSSLLGIPVSSNHTKNCAVMGVGASRRLSNVNWNIAKSIVITWFLTFPFCGLLGYILTKVIISII